MNVIFAIFGGNPLLFVCKVGVSRFFVGRTHKNFVDFLKLHHLLQLAVLRKLAAFSFRSVCLQTLVDELEALFDDFVWSAAVVCSLEQNQLFAAFEGVVESLSVVAWD